MLFSTEAPSLGMPIFKNVIMRNILITGGAGFIGSHLALKLVDLGYHVRILDVLSEQIHGSDPESSPLFRSIRGKVDFIHGDVVDRRTLTDAIVGQDAIIHLAAETGTGQSMYDIEKYVKVNVGGTGLLLDVIANTKHSVKKLIVASSRAIYGEGKYECETHGIVYPSARNAKDMENSDFECKCDICNRPLQMLPTAEDSKIHPSSVYGITKHAQEQLCMVAGQSLGISTVALRYQNVYGPGQSLSNPYTGILSIFSTIINNGNCINIFEDGNESRDFIHVSDVVDATILSLENEEANNQVFNVGTGISTNVSLVASKLMELYRTEVSCNITGNFRVGDIRHNIADISKINEMLGFKPKWSFDIGLKSFTDWVVEQDMKPDLFQDSILELKEKGLFK